MADYITQFPENEVVSRDNFNSRIAEANTALSNKANVYTSLTQLGLSIGTETIDAIITAMKSKSSLWLQINTEIDGYNSTEYPYKYGFLKIDRLSPNRISIIYIAPSNGYEAEHWVGQYWGESFQGWVKIATAMPPQEYNLLLADGINKTRKSCYIKTQDEVVTLNMGVKFATETQSGVIAATLPVGFRPDEHIEAPARYSDGVIGTIYIKPTGEIIFYKGQTIPTDMICYVPTISFVAYN